MSNGLTVGWYTFDFLDDDVGIDLEGCIGYFNRRSEAQIEAEEWFRNYIGYWDGRQWLDVAAVCGDVETAEIVTQRPVHTQSRIDSFAEALTNTAIGFLVSLVTWIIVARMYGIPMSTSTSLQITGWFTVVSVLRQYVLRRLFDGRSPWQALKACFSRVSTLR